MGDDLDVKKLMEQIRKEKAPDKPIKIIGKERFGKSNFQQPIFINPDKIKPLPLRPQITKTLLENQPIAWGVVIHRTATVGLFFMLTFTFVWSWYLYSNADARAIAFQTSYANNTNHVYAELASLTSSVGSLRHTVSLLEDRTGKLEAKPNLNLSDINAKLNTIQLQTSYLTRSLDANLTSLQVQLTVANRQISILLAQNGSGSLTHLENGSEVTTPPYLLRYQNLTCRTELMATFCTSDWCRSNLDPEWLCNAGQVMPEYSGWVEQSCACAREAGLPY